MDSSLLGELLIKARKQKDDVLLLVNGDFKKIIHPYDNFEFQKDALVLRDLVINLNAINVANIIPVPNIKIGDEECYKPSKKSMRLI